jgi:hypothetical protein
MEKQELTHIQSRVNELRQNLARIADDADLQEFLQIILKPGWTSFAEATFAKALIEAMHGNAKTLSSLKTALLEGSRLVAPK